MKKKLVLLILGFVLIVCSQVFANDQKYFTKRLNVTNTSSQNVDKYINKVSNELKSNWFAPKHSNSVEIVFKIRKNGTYKNLRITDPSNVKKDNQAALDAVMFSSPFDKLPEKINELTVIYKHSGNNQLANTSNNIKVLALN
ncbi:MAG: TonB C-terminal domain-containing protein [Cyanobacteriota bacterium]